MSNGRRRHPNPARRLDPPRRPRPQDVHRPRRRLALIMPTEHLLGSRTFTQKSQELFAAFSRDRNPLHIDPLVARRTPFGVPVVHGVHTLAAALDLFGTGVNDRQPVRSVKASFLKYVLIGDTVEFSFSEAT